jgi:hypothetical protein
MSEVHVSKLKRAIESIGLKYGLSVSDFEALWERCGGACEICGKSLRSTLAGDLVQREVKNDVACVDHCHETGAVRGILCAHCNSGLGFFKDSIEGLSAAMDYLSGPSREAKTQRQIGCEEFHSGLNTKAAKRFGDQLKKEERSLWARKRGPVQFKYLFERPVARGGC